MNGVECGHVCCGQARVLDVKNTSALCNRNVCRPTGVVCVCGVARLKTSILCVIFGYFMMCRFGICQPLV